MASLRDQLVAKGLTSKKRARKASRELKAQRKAEQGSRKKKREAEAEAAAAEAAEAEAERTERLAQRKAREATRDAAEHALRVRNLLAGNRVRPGSGHRFWHRSLDGRHLQEMQVSSGMAYQLRCGEVALAHFDHGTWSETVLLPKRAALKLHALAPQLLLFFVEDATGLSAPDLAFHQRTWDPEFGPRRATAADLERFRAPS